MAGGGGQRRALALAFALALAPWPAAAQEAPPGVPPGAPFLIINQDRLLTGSKAGQALLAEQERQRDALRTEARALDSSFEAEERKLTEERPTLPPEEFRRLSDAIDARVVEARRQQDERASALAQEFDQRRRAFYAQVAPILVMLMDRYGAKAIFDENSVLLADQSLNITQAVIAEIDARASTTGSEGAAPAPAPADAGPAPDAGTPAAPATDGQAGGN
jgi:Skp family chaperone for outer membrane proteins